MRFVCACVCVCVLRISRNNTKTIQQQIKTCWAWKVLKTHPPPCSRPTCLTYYQPWLRAAGHKVKCPIQDFSTHMSVLMKNKVGEGKQKGNTPGRRRLQKRTFGEFLPMIFAVSEHRSVRNQTQITRRDNNCAAMTDGSPPQEELISTVT